MNNQKKAILIVAGLGALATFMPWVTLPIIGSINGAHGEGWFNLAIFAIPIIMCLIGDKTEQLSGVKLYIPIALGLIASIIGVWKIIEFKSKMNTMDDNPFAKAMESSISIGFGLYLIILAGIALPIAAFYYKDKSQ